MIPYDLAYICDANVFLRFLKVVVRKLEKAYESTLKTIKCCLNKDITNYVLIWHYFLMFSVQTPDALSVITKFQKFKKKGDLFMTLVSSSRGTLRYLLISIE